MKTALILSGIIGLAMLVWEIIKTQIRMNRVLDRLENLLDEEDVR
jgi:hypothetical protein